MKSVEDIIENIQTAFLDAGGRCFTQKEIKYMTVEDLLKLLTPNNVEIEIKFKPKH